MHTRNAALAAPQNSSEVASVASELRSAFAELQSRFDAKFAEVSARPAGAVTVEQVRAELAPHAAAVADLQEALTRANRPQSPQALTLERSEAQNAAFARFLRANDPSELIALGAWKPEMATRAAQGMETTQPLGGYVVLPTIDTNIDRVARVFSNIKNFVRSVQIGGREYVRHVKASGAVFTWVSEGGSEPAADAANYKEVRIDAHEGRSIIAVSRTLIADAYFDIGAEVSLELGEARGVAMGDAFINGSGIGQPKGILSANNAYAEQTGRTEPAFGTLGFVKTGSASDWGATATTKIDAFQQVIARLKPQYLANANFFMNRTSISQVMLFKDANGQLLWVPSLLAGNAATLRGYPVQNIEETPDGASGKFPAVFGDLAQGYTAVDRQGLEVLVNPYRTSGMVQFEAFQRFGGGINKSEAIKLIKWSV